MKRKKEEIISSVLNYTICLTLVGIVILGTFLLPQIYGYNVDNRTIGKVHYTQREEVVLATNLNLTVKDRAAIVTNLVSEGGLSLFMNLEGGQLYDEDLVKHVVQEIRWAAGSGVLPSELTGIDFNDQAGSLSADYYILSSAVSEYGEMALWRVKYTTAENEEITLLVDAANYKIYYGELGGSYLTEAWMNNLERGGEGAYMSACMDYYEAEYAEYVNPVLEYIFEIEDAGIYGWMVAKDNLGETDRQEVVFGFDVFWEYFRGESLLAIYGQEEKSDTTMIQNPGE